MPKNFARENNITVDKVQDLIKKQSQQYHEVLMSLTSKRQSSLVNG